MLQKIKEFLSPPIFDDDDKTRIASHVFLLSKMALGLFPILLIIYFFLVGSIEITFLLFFGLFLCGVLPILLAKKGYIRQAGIVFTVILWLTINYTTLDTGGVRAIGFGGNLIVLVAAAFLIDIRATFFFGIATSALGLALAYLQSIAVLPPIAERVTVYTAWVIQTVLLVLNTGLLYIAADKIRTALKHWRTAEKEVRELNRELLSAYNTTLEGWAKALELRDKETEGHSRRVITLTQMLAAELGASEEELRYMYYGALLHDIGKMGIPDEILHKPNKLTSEEWEIVKYHPTQAYQLLKDIEYLQQAIEIPYCHHEKWNGEGYPRGLKGNEIPLSARIFAVVDVWDALNSERPYKKAWAKDEVVQYMKEQSGIQFDPKVIEIFLTKVVTNI